MDKLKYDQRQRLCLIEVLALWEGELSTKHLCLFFGIQRQQASRDIKTYMTIVAPENLTYDPSIKRYVASSEFSPKLINEDVSLYVDYLVKDPSQTSIESNVFVGRGIVEDIIIPKAQIKTNVFQAVLKSCKEQHSVSVDVRTLAEPTQKLSVIAPHSIFFLQGACYVRAYCYERLKFVNIDLRQIYNIARTQDELTIYTKEMDDDWNTMVNVNIVPDQRLTAVQRKIVEHEFAMDFGSLLINIRASMIPFMLDALKINVSVLEPDPLQQKVIIDNLNAIKRWVF